MNRRILAVGLLLVALVVATPATAAPILVNGGFEAGFAGWTKVDQAFGDGSFFPQTGTTSPVNLFSVPAPPEGLIAVMTDAQGPGAHVLYQDFVVPASVGAASLDFSWFVHNHAADFVTPATLDFAASPVIRNQQARVDILSGGTDPFSLLAADLLLNAFRTEVGSPLVSGYNVSTTDLTALFAAHLGETLRLRFAETDNVEIFNFGVDAVNLDVEAAAAVPEPGTLTLLGLGLAASAVGRRRSRSRK